MGSEVSMKFLRDIIGDFMRNPFLRNLFLRSIGNFLRDIGKFLNF